LQRDEELVGLLGALVEQHGQQTASQVAQVSGNANHVIQVSGSGNTIVR